MYFSYLPIIEYGNRFMEDITRKVSVLYKTDLANITEVYTQDDFDTPQKVAQDFYGSTEYDYILYLLNNIIHPFEDWFKDSQTLNDYIENKYGEAADEVREYIYPNGLRFSTLEASQLNGQHSLATPITNRQYEEYVNESKRDILIINPDIIQNVVDAISIELADKT